MVDKLIATAWTARRAGCSFVDECNHLVAWVGRKYVTWHRDVAIQREANRQLSFMVVEFSNLSNDF